MYVRDIVKQFFIMCLLEQRVNDLWKFAESWNQFFANVLKKADVIIMFCDRIKCRVKCMTSGRTSCLFVYGIPLSPSMFTLLGMSIFV